MRYRLQFHGRKLGASGLYYDFDWVVDADNEAEALEKLSETHERYPGGRWGAEVKVTMLGEPDEIG